MGEQSTLQRGRGWATSMLKIVFLKSFVWILQTDCFWRRQFTPPYENNLCETFSCRLLCLKNGFLYVFEPPLLTKKLVNAVSLILFGLSLNEGTNVRTNDGSSQI